MIITLDIFSGRPNPSWSLSESDANQLINRVAGRAMPEAMAVDNVLGYRGMIAVSSSDELLPEGLPASFRIGGGSALDIDETVQWLLSTGRHVVDEELVAVAQDTLEVRRRGIDLTAPAEPLQEDTEAAVVPAAPCVIRNTAYNPNFWNRPEVQPYNNCYNYAMNDRTDTFAQPGRISGHPNNIMQCANVAAAANWDGCTATCSGTNKQVALVVWPGFDYHWYRRQSEGFWGHKPGGTAARNTDNRNRVIDGTTLTPLNCDRGPYTNFCGYRFSPCGMPVR